MSTHFKVYEDPEREEITIFYRTEGMEKKRRVDITFNPFTAVDQEATKPVKS